MNHTVNETELFEIVLSVALALVFARLFGYLFDRIKQPPVIGEIFAGLLLGGFGFGILAGKSFFLFSVSIQIPQLSYSSEAFTFLAKLGILFLMFLSGLDINFSDFNKVKKRSIFVAVGGVIAPLLVGLLVSLLFGFSWYIGLIIGLILVATSVGVPVRVLMDLQKLNTDVGLTILGAAVIDDVISIILFVSIIGVSSSFDIAFLGFKILIFFAIFLLLGLKIIDKIFNLSEKIQLPKALLSLSLAIFLIYSFFSYQSGIAGITGAFVAGIVISHAMKSRKVIGDIKAISYGLFIPLFFVWIGANVDLTTLTTFNVLGFALAIILVSIFTKIIGCGIGGKLAGMTNKKALQTGIGMIPRLEMALIIVGAAISEEIFIGEIGQQILSTIILVTLVTTMVTPFLLRASFKY